MAGAGVWEQRFLDSAPGSATICCSALSHCLDLAVCKMGRVEDQDSCPSPGGGKGLLTLLAVQRMAERLCEDFSRRLGFAGLPGCLFLLWDGDPKEFGVKAAGLPVRRLFLGGGEGGLELLSKAHEG